MRSTNTLIDSFLSIDDKVITDVLNTIKEFYHTGKKFKYFSHLSSTIFNFSLLDGCGIPHDIINNIMNLLILLNVDEQLFYNRAKISINENFLILETKKQLIYLLENKVSIKQYKRILKINKLSTLK